MIRRLLTLTLAASLLVCLAMAALLMRSLRKAPGAINAIARCGLAASERRPDGSIRVFLPETADGQEKRFGDQQFLAVLPLLQHIEGVNELDIHGSSVTDSAIAKLAALASLRELDVGNTRVTANGILQLRGLTGLTLITVDRDQLADPDMAAVRAAFPAARIMIWPKVPASAPAPIPPRADAPSP